MTRKPAFWILLAVLGLSGSFVAFRLFPIAFPILSVEIDMDRQGALGEARDLATRFGWEPDGFRQAASFSHLDPAFQTYLELEGGGFEELNRLAREEAISLYAWRVRHFLEGTVEEAEIRFTPSGAPYGFRLRLSEETPGTNLSPEGARELALSVASAHWGIEPIRYELLESSQEQMPGGRIDQTFVFERSDLDLGEARLRLRLVVAGDQLVEVTPFFHVPEAFLRQYQDTRNANESIALAGTIAFLLLFLVLGGGIGGVHLLKGGWLEWKAPLIWGGVVAGFMALGTVNSLPLAWMSYDTALPSQVHVATQVLSAGLVFVAGTGLLAFIFMVGEGLLRLGFPGQIQQWRMWAPEVANSNPALGRTAAPYLVLGIELAFVVAFYLVTSRLAGWWSPASALAEPDLLATYFPWLTAVGTSLFAAFSEETLFRAIPIGAAAIMGRRYGRPGLWIWGAVILQALVFGASHANYPQQPAYARVVEIFPTYLAWGAACVYFGLVPSIIGHFLYDLVLFALPLFSADIAGIWVDRSIVVLAGLLPLLVVLWVRFRRGGLSMAPEWALNRHWRPRSGFPPGGHPPDGAPGRADPDPEALEPAAEAEGAGPSLPGPPLLPSWASLTLVVFALSGITLWAMALGRADSPRLTLTRAQAEATARTALEERGVSLGSEWTPLFSVSTELGTSHAFVWEKGSPEDYRRLLGDYLGSPGWRIRFVSFEREPADRAESYTVSLPEGGSEPWVRHVLPEARSGASLTEDEGRILALDALADQLGTPSELVREIVAEETARPNRRDWTFTFAATQNFPLEEGEGRLEVRIAGSEIVGLSKYVHVPEDWEREERGKEGRRALAIIPAASVLLLLAVAAAILAVVLWARGSLATKPLHLLTGAMAPLLLLSGVNEWPNTIGLFNTQLSFGNQVGLAVLGLGLGSGVLAAGVGLFGALGHSWIRNRPPSARRPALVGLALGVGGAGFSSLATRLGPAQLPDWPSYGGAASYLPWLSTALSGWIQILIATSVGLLLLAALQRIKETRWSWAGIPLVLLVAFTLSSGPFGGGWVSWGLGASGLAAGIWLAWILCRLWGWAILPGVMAGPVLLGILETAIKRPFPGHTLGAVFSLAGVALITVVWSRALRGASEPGRFPRDPHRDQAMFSA